MLFECKRTEKDYVEEYEMKVLPASATQKAKIFLDDRDLDQSDSNGTQTVKSIVVAPGAILMTIEARFDPEVVQGAPYSAGTVMTQMTLSRNTGVMKKVETINGGILGATLGNGTRVSEELCRPVSGR
ncbi:hypothetical protein ICN24_07635 [Polynucleobacter sp. UK-Kesae-W10]|nr:hypothetical protein [Polynucleobacter sp. UK-Kesae-W10]